MDRLIIDADNHVAGAKTRSFGVTAFLNGPDQHALAVFDAEEITELWRDVLDH